MLLVSFTAFNHFTKANKVNPSCETWLYHDITATNFWELPIFPVFQTRELFHAVLKRGLITVTRESYRTSFNVTMKQLSNVIHPWLNMGDIIL